MSDYLSPLETERIERDWLEPLWSDTEDRPQTPWFAEYTPEGGDTLDQYGQRYNADGLPYSDPELKAQADLFWASAPVDNRPDTRFGMVYDLSPEPPDSHSDYEHWRRNR